MDSSTLVNVVIGAALSYIGYNLRDLTISVKTLTKEVSSFETHVAEKYITKDDCKEIRSNCPAKAK